MIFCRPFRANNNNSVRDPLPVVPGIVFDEKRYITGSETKVGESPFFSLFLLRIPRNLHLVLQAQVTRELEGDVTRDDSQRRFLAQHRVAAWLQRCFEWLQHRSNIATLCCAKGGYALYRQQNDKTSCIWWLAFCSRHYDSLAKTRSRMTTAITFSR